MLRSPTVAAVLVALSLVLAVGCSDEYKEPAGHQGLQPTDGDLSQATTSSVLESEGGDSKGHPRRIGRLLVSGNLDALEADLEALQRLARDNPAEDHLLHSAYGAFGDMAADWVPAVDAWVERRPESPQALAARALLRARVGWDARGTKSSASTTDAQFEAMHRWHDLAMGDALASLDLDPANPIPYRILIDSSRTGGSLADCKRWADEGLGHNPASFSVWEGLALCFLPRWGGSGEALERVGSSAFSQASANPRLRSLRGFSEWEQGRLLSKSDPERALEHLDAALEFGGHWRFYESRANTLQRLGRLDEELEALSRALELKPFERSLLIRRALLLGKQGRWEESLADLGTLPAPREPEGRFLEARTWALGRTLKQLRLDYENKRWPETRDLADALILVEPSDLEALFMRGRAYMHLGELDRGVADLERLLAVPRYAFSAGQNLDWCWAKDDQFSRIVEMWTGVARVVPEDGRVYLERAGALRRLGRSREAAADLDRACSLGSDKACEIQATL